MSAVEVASFEVVGKPVPQGSKTVFMVGGRPVLADANSAALKPWRKAVAAAARAAKPAAQVEGPVEMWLTFTFERPKTVKRVWPAVKPDIDKLVRAVLDGITDSGLWKDDAQVVVIRELSKRYGAFPGVRVRVGAIREEGMD